ncbi:MAG: inorganic diphosphatase [Phycisphaeraceae bacterium]
MTKRFLEVPAGPTPPAVVNVIVEIAKGRRSKFEMDKETGMFRLDRYLYSSLHYPGDYGFIPHTLAQDGDPLDIIVMVNEPTFTGCLIEARPIGLFKMTDRGVNDYKILAVPNSDPTYDDFHDLWRVPPHFLREVEHFFATYKQLEEAIVVTQGWESSDKAKAEIEFSISRYESQVDKMLDREKATQDRLPNATPTPYAPQAAESDKTVVAMPKKAPAKKTKRPTRAKTSTKKSNGKVASTKTAKKTKSTKKR